MLGWRVAVLVAVLGAMSGGGVMADAPAAPMVYSTDAHREVTQLPAAPVVTGNVDDLKSIQSRVEAVVKEALPATVAIVLEDGQGSGVIVSKDGYVLTAGHVSGKPGQKVTIVLANGRELHGKALGANNNIDSGMVKITDRAPDPKKGFPFVPLGTAKILKAGECLVAMGHPVGYRVGRPPVVRLGRVLLATHQVLGTDCPLINGDSGGPVFDLEGKLVGIHSRIGTTLTTNIDVPIDTFSVTWDRLAKGEEWGGTKTVLSRWWGGGGSRRYRRMGRRWEFGRTMWREAGPGRLVSRVKVGTAAEKAGLHVGDVVLSVDGKNVAGADGLAEQINEHSPGDVVTMALMRGGKRVELKVTLGEAK